VFAAVSDIQQQTEIVLQKAAVVQWSLNHQQLRQQLRYYEAPRQLRSRGENILWNSASVLNFSKRAFCHASPTVWNSRPQTVISDSTVTTNTFKNRLKSALYGCAFLQ